MNKDNDVMINTRYTMLDNEVISKRVTDRVIIDKGLLLTSHRIHQNLHLQAMWPIQKRLFGRVINVDSATKIIIVMNVLSIVQLMKGRNE